MADGQHVQGRAGGSARARRSARGGVVAGGALAVLLVVLLVLPGAGTLAAADLPAGVAGDGPAATPGNVSFTAAEEAWLERSSVQLGPVTAAVESLDRMLSDDQLFVALLDGDPETVARVRSDIATIDACHERVAAVGDPPTQQMAEVREALASACDHYIRGTNELRRGLGDMDAMLLQEAIYAWEEGNEHLMDGATLLDLIEQGRPAEVLRTPA